MGLIFAGVVGGASLYQQEITNLARMLFSRQGQTVEKQKNTRGTIFDRNFKELALSLDRVSVYVRPRDLGDIHGSAEQLANVLGMNDQELLERLDKESQRVWLAKNISLEEEKAVTDLHLAGVFLDRDQVRYYPYKNVAAHVIGFADHNMGLAGVEHYYNRLLEQASISQSEFPHINLEGRSRTGIGGQHLVLTIDLKIQDVLEKYVAALGAAHKGAEIVTLLMETETGAIVANANFPSFDPNIFYQYKKEALANILFEPVAIPLKVQKFFHDAMNLRANWDQYQQNCPWSIAAESPEVAAKVHSWFQSTFGATSELDFSGQSVREGGIAGKNGSVAPLNDSASIMSLPQATPMQMLVALNSLVNSGNSVVPHVLDRILERNGEHEYLFRSSPAGVQRGEVVQNATPEIRRLLKAQGQNGVLDSVRIDVDGHSFQATDKGGESVRNRMMFVMLPADNPELILLVMLRQPYLDPSTAPAGEGLDLVGPMEKILPSMVALQQVHKNISDMMSMTERKEGNFQQKQKEKTTVGLTTIVEQHQEFMPDLVGMSLRKALRLLQDKKIKVQIQGTGRVVAQTPAADKPLGSVRECLLTLKKDEKTGTETSAKISPLNDEKNQKKAEKIKK